ncbi:MAG TPA: hypothetical protein VEW48_15375 [Thermoanaerobaculia bacterium]|nr:hypothetical protein [Thermoanaerobaculia bacterium]
MLHSTMRRTSLSIVLLSLLAFGSAVPVFALQQVDGRQANARKLLRIAGGASHRLIQRAQGRLDARSRPFWEALLRMNADLDRVGAGLRIRDLSFFQALRSGTSSLAEVQVTWALAGVRDPDIEQDLRTLAAAYDRLRDRYGPEWVRYQAGRPLSEDERVRFARMRAEQSFLASKLEPLRNRVEQTGDHATAGELTLLLAQVHGVATAPATLGDYLDASVATDSIRGAWYGARAAHTADEEGWAEADEVVSEITTDDSVGFVFTADLKSVQDWSFVETETDVPADIAQAADLQADTEEATVAPEMPEGIVLDEKQGEDEVESEAPAEAEAASATPENQPEGTAEEQLGDEPDTGAAAIEDLDAPAPAHGKEAIEEEDLSVDAAPGKTDPKACTAEGPACEDSTAPPPPAATPAAPPKPAPPGGSR